MTIFIKLVYQHIPIFFNLPPTSSHLHPLQVENCGGNSWLVVDKGYNCKYRLERVKLINIQKCLYSFSTIFLQILTPKTSTCAQSFFCFRSILVQIKSQITQDVAYQSRSNIPCSLIIWCRPLCLLYNADVNHLSTRVTFMQSLWHRFD